MAQQIVDLVNLGGGVQSLLSPQAITQAATGGVVFDAQNLDDAATNAILSIGAIATGITNFAVQIEECSTTNGTFTAIPGMVFTAVTQTTGNANTVQVVRGQRTYQYVRANVTAATGTTVSVQASVVLVGQGKIVPQASGYDRYPSS